MFANLLHPGLIAAAALAAATILPAHAADPRNLVPQGGAQAALELSLNALESGGSRNVEEYEKLGVGAKVRLCFKATETGYVSLWSLDASGNVSRILPNKYTASRDRGSDGIKVDAAIRHCIAESGLVAEGSAGQATERWWLEVGRPLGRADLYLHWTPTLDKQLPADSFVDIDSLSRAVGKSGTENFAAMWFSYEVTDR